MTDALGPRRDLEIAAAHQREVTQHRFTSIDRELDGRAEQHRVEITPAHRSGDRFRRSLQLQRLRHLEGLHLATKSEAGVWRLKDGWQQTLKAMERRGDIIRTLAAGLEPAETARGVRFFEERPLGSEPLTGVVISQGPDDELRCTRFLLVEDLEGTRWHVSATGIEPVSLPPRGGIVEVAHSEPAPRVADKVIAEIGRQTGGYYSDALHAEADPTASFNYRESHKRRLEALRRAGLVTRRTDGVWTIDKHYLPKVTAYEASRGGSIKLSVRSWMTLEAQTETLAETWLDRTGVEGAQLSKRITDAHTARLKFLQARGLLEDGERQLSVSARDALRAEEVRRAVSTEGKRSGRDHVSLAKGEPFEGKFEKTLYLASGRRALIGNEKSFVLVPWRSDLERHRGRSLIIEHRAKGLSWSFPSGRARGLSR